MPNFPHDQPINKYSKVVTLLREIASKLGLSLHAYGVVPPEGDDPVVLQASFVRNEHEEIEPSDLEQARYDEMFATLVEGTKIEDTESLRRRFDDGEFFDPGI